MLFLWVIGGFMEYEISGGVAVAKTKGRPKTSGRDDITVKVDRTIISRAKMLASYHGISVAELISETLRGPFDKMVNEMLRKTGGK